MNKQPKRSSDSKRVARFLKQHEASYRALINLLIRQAEREVREELARQAEPDNDERHGTRMGTGTAILALAVGLAVVVLTMQHQALWLERPARRDSRLYRVVLPAGPDRAALFMATLHGLLLPAWRRLLHGQPNLSLELVGTRGQAYLRLAIPSELYLSVVRLLHAAYPDAQLIPEDDGEERQLAPRAVATLGLYQHHFLPIRIEPKAGLLTPLLAVLAEAGDTEAIVLQLLVQPLPTSWRGHMLGRANRLRQRSGRMVHEAIFGPSRERVVSRSAIVTAQHIEQKAESLPFACAGRVVVRSGDAGRAHGLLWDVAAALRTFSGPNSFDFRQALSHRRLVRQVEARSVPFFGRFILNADELAQLWNTPADLPAHLLHAALPVPLPALQDGRVLGAATYGPPGRLVTQALADAATHTHILGPTGVGKSVLMANLIRQDVTAGRGVAVLDAKADLVATVLKHLPRERLDEVIVISPRQTGRAIGLNPLACPPGEEPARLADNLLAAFQRIYEQWWGPRIEEVLRSALLTLVHYPGATLAHIPPLLTDPLFRAEVTQHLDDPIGVGSFWALYEQLTERQRLEAITPVLSRLRAFLSLPRVRRLLCQPQPTIDLPTIVREGGIVLVDLATAVWGESSARLVGSLVFSQLWTAARSRLATSEAERSPFLVYVDEFSAFINLAGSFSETLAQARGLGLPLVLAHQNLGQLRPEMREAVLSNARTRVVFQCGQDDARYLAREFAPLSAESLMNLPAYHAAVRLAVQGQTSRPFTIRTLPLPAPMDTTIAQEAVRRSAEQFGRPVDDVDRELREALHFNHPTDPAKSVGRRARS